MNRFLLYAEGGNALGAYDSLADGQYALLLSVLEDLASAAELLLVEVDASGLTVAGSAITGDQLLKTETWVERDDNLAAQFRAEVQTFEFGLEGHWSMSGTATHSIDSKLVMCRPWLAAA